MGGVASRLDLPEWSELGGHGASLVHLFSATGAGSESQFRRRRTPVELERPKRRLITLRETEPAQATERRLLAEFRWRWRHRGVGFPGGEPAFATLEVPGESP